MEQWKKLRQAVLTGGLVLGVLATSGAVAVAAPRIPAVCVELLGVPASGEVRKDDNPHNPANMGMLPSAVFKQFSSNMDKRGISVIPTAIFYPAVGFHSIADIPKMFRSVDAGAKELKKVLTAPAACPMKRRVIVALSQGAWVVQKALETLPESAQRQMVVLIYGSPVFEPEDGLAIKDPSQKWGGVAFNTFLPSWVTGRTYCLKGDAICESTPSNWWRCRKLNASTCPHSQYPRLVPEGATYLTKLF